MWLGPRRGAATDWTTQQWVKVTGRRVSLRDAPWLDGPSASVHGVGTAFFDDLAAERGLTVDRTSRPRGLFQFQELAGPALDPGDVDPAVRRFYEQTSEYEMDSWSEWCGAFKPFGFALARVFSRRLQQLNVPLGPLDTSEGTSSEVLHLREKPGGPVVHTAWVRTLHRTRSILYAGTYSTVMVPGHPNRCVKVVFPLPNGNAIVILKPETDGAGALTVTSAGKRFGDPGFYFTVRSASGAMWARYVRTMQESIRAYAAGNGEVRADHTLRIFGRVFLRLHYRLRPVAATTS